MRQNPVAHFDIRPTVGALPLTFGMHRDEVHSALGLRVTPPDTSVHNWTGEGGVTECPFAGFSVRYDDDWLLDHITFLDGPIALSINGQQVWSTDDHPDPNPLLLALDPAPVRRGSILIYLPLGICTSGYRHGNRGNGVINVGIRSWAERFAKGRRVPANMNRYYRPSRRPHNQTPHRTGAADTRSWFQRLFGRGPGH
jgi:hypothetical protein